MMLSQPFYLNDIITCLHNQSIVNRVLRHITTVGEMCGNITEFGMMEDHLSLQVKGDPLPPQTRSQTE